MQELGPKLERWERSEKSQGDLGDGVPATSATAGYRDLKARGLRVDAATKAVRESTKLSTQEKRAEIERIHAEAIEENDKAVGEALTRLAVEIAGAIPEIEHPPLAPDVRQAIYAQLPMNSLMKLRAFYLGTDNPQWAAAIAQHPGVLAKDGPNAGTVVPVVDEEAAFERARRLATPAQRKRHAGLTRLSVQLQGVAGMMRQALKDNSLQTTEERFKRAG